MRKLGPKIGVTYQALDQFRDLHFWQSQCQKVPTKLHRKRYKSVTLGNSEKQMCLRAGETGLFSSSNGNVFFFFLKESSVPCCNEYCVTMFHNCCQQSQSNEIVNGGPEHCHCDVNCGCIPVSVTLSICDTGATKDGCSKRGKM